MRGIAAFVGSAAPQFVDAPEPDGPGVGQVLGRTLELGICGTDRDILASQQPCTAPGEKQLVLGHECLGRVEAVGRDVDSLRSGDFVVPLVRRPKPEAMDRRPDLLPFGQYVERGIVELPGYSLPWWVDEPRHLIRVETEYLPSAVFTEPQSVAEKGVNEALRLQQARLGEEAWVVQPPRVLVTGLGPIAFAAVIAAACRGWPTTVLGRDAADTSRAELVRQFGADYLTAETAGFENRDAERDGFDLVLECTGAEEIVLRCATVMAACGVMVWLGSSRLPRSGQLNVARFVRDGLVRNHLFLGSVNAAQRDFQDAIRHLSGLQEEKPDLLAALLTARVAPDDALWHFAHRQPQGIKTVVEYR